jgi:hypothetical protein
MNTETSQNNPWIIRTDFSDDSAWDAVCQCVKAPVLEFDEEFFAYVHFVDSLEYKDCTPAEVFDRLQDTYRYSFIFVTDHVTFSHPEMPILVLGLKDDSIQEFRAIPSQIQGIENNLSIANMDYAEFAAMVDEDGIFRGFETSEM